MQTGLGILFADLFCWICLKQRMVPVSSLNIVEIVLAPDMESEKTGAGMLTKMGT
jgi:hypothetical protein